MERRQITFYRSFYNAIRRIKKASDRLQAYDAVFDYAFKNVQPDFEKLPDAAAIVFDLVCPTLDAANRRAENGLLGGRPPAAEKDGKPLKNKEKLNTDRPKNEEENKKAKKTETNQRQPKAETGESKKEGEGEKEVEVESDSYKETIPLPVGSGMEKKAAASAAASNARAEYLDRINPAASSACLAELAAFAEKMGAACCSRAMDIALDSKVPTWPYIRAILRDKLQRGVRCLADWDKVTERREQEAQGEKSGAPPKRRALSEMEREAIRRTLAETGN